MDNLKRNKIDFLSKADHPRISVCSYDLDLDLMTFLDGRP